MYRWGNLAGEISACVIEVTRFVGVEECEASPAGVNCGEGHKQTAGLRTALRSACARMPHRSDSAVPGCSSDIADCDNRKSCSNAAASSSSRVCCQCVLAS